MLRSIYSVDRKQVGINNGMVKIYHVSISGLYLLKPVPATLIYSLLYF